LINIEPFLVSFLLQSHLKLISEWEIPSRGAARSNVVAGGFGAGMVLVVGAKAFHSSFFSSFSLFLQFIFQNFISPRGGVWALMRNVL